MALLETLLAEVQGSNVLLFIILILLFVVGYRLLQAVIQLGLVAILSGVFLVVMEVAGVGPAVTIDRFILFMVLGTGLFILYSSIATVMTLVDSVAGVVFGLIRWSLGPVFSAKNQQRPWRNTLHNVKDRTKPTRGSSSKEKEIVLGELDDE